MAETSGLGTPNKMCVRNNIIFVNYHHTITTECQDANESYHCNNISMHTICGDPCSNYKKKVKGLGVVVAILVVLQVALVGGWMRTCWILKRKTLR